MVHWGRFPAFRHVRNELKKPHLTMKDADRGAVFMRWKEKFLVPDHRVQDISGASFAGTFGVFQSFVRVHVQAGGSQPVYRTGFYYVCVDFNPQPAASHATHDSPILEDFAESSSPPHVTVPKPEPSPRHRRESASRGARKMVRSPSSSQAVQANVATMSGFYFHQQSEPYVVNPCYAFLGPILIERGFADTSSCRWCTYPTTRALASSSGRWQLLPCLKPKTSWGSSGWACIDTTTSSSCMYYIDRIFRVLCFGLMRTSFRFVLLSPLISFFLFLVSGCPHAVLSCPSYPLVLYRTPSERIPSHLVLFEARVP